MSRIDRDALERAIVACREQGDARRSQIDDKLASEPWHEVATFAAFSAQIDSIGLKPWQLPPCAIDLDEALREPFGDTRGMREGGELLRRLLDAGLSRYEPSPFAALERTKPKRVATAR